MKKILLMIIVMSLPCYLGAFQEIKNDVIQFYKESLERLSLEKNKYYTDALKQRELSKADLQKRLEELEEGKITALKWISFFQTANRIVLTQRVQSWIEEKEKELEDIERIRANVNKKIQEYQVDYIPNVLDFEKQETENHQIIKDLETISTFEEYINSFFNQIVLLRGESQRESKNFATFIVVALWNKKYELLESILKENIEKTDNYIEKKAFLSGVLDELLHIKNEYDIWYARYINQRTLLDTIAAKFGYANFIRDEIYYIDAQIVDTQKIINELVLCYISFGSHMRRIENEIRGNEIIECDKTSLYTYLNSVKKYLDSHVLDHEQKIIRTINTIMVIQKLPHYFNSALRYLKNKYGDLASLIDIIGEVSPLLHGNEVNNRNPYYEFQLLQNQVTNYLRNDTK